MEWAHGSTERIWTFSMHLIFARTGHLSECPPEPWLNTWTSSRSTDLVSLVGVIKPRTDEKPPLLLTRTGFNQNQPSIELQWRAVGGELWVTWGLSLEIQWEASEGVATSLRGLWLEPWRTSYGSSPRRTSKDNNRSFIFVFPPSHLIYPFFFYIFFNEIPRNHLLKSMNFINFRLFEWQEAAAVAAASDPYRYVEKRKPIPDPQVRRHPIFF